MLQTIGSAAGAAASRLTVNTAHRMNSDTRHRIVYTLTDESPLLASHSLLPILGRFLHSHVRVELADISLAHRILALFPDALQPGQRVPDVLAELGKLCKTPDANIIKLPNVSASVPQLQGAIAELQAQGFAVPDFTTAPSTAAELDAAARYVQALGSAVDPVLREGNSDRHAADVVEEHARRHPPALKPWRAGCMWETGAADTAPELTQDFLSSGRLQWDSLGEYSAGASALRHVGRTANDKHVDMLADTLTDATDGLLSSTPTVHDTRLSNLELACLWGDLAAGRAASFKPLARSLTTHHATIERELAAVVGHPPPDLGGYFHPLPDSVAGVMHPSPTFWAALAESMH